MPYGMPNILMKGPVLQALDAMLNAGLGLSQSYKNKLKRISDALALPASRIADMMVQEGVLKKGSESDDHLRDHWFPDPTQPAPYNVWWSGLQFIEPVAKIGYRNAILEDLKRRAAGKRPLPFDSYWACIPGWDDSDPEYFQVAFTVTDRQITVVVFTPPEPKLEIPDADDRVAEPVYFSMLAGEPKAGLRKIRVTSIGEKKIALYQVERLRNQANRRRRSERPKSPR